MINRAIATFAAAILTTIQVHAQPITVERAWSRATPADVGVAYFTIHGGADTDLLISVRTPVARDAQLHRTERNGMMTMMRSLDPVPISPYDTVQFAPGDRHVMLIGLKHALHAGDHFPLTLHFAKAGDLATEAMVMPAGTTEPPKSP